MYYIQLGSVGIYTDYGTVKEKQLVVLEEEAFFGLCNVDAVILNEGLKTIKESAFDECCSLRRIEIPSTVNEIESNSFSGAVILCRKDSPAMEYALENGMEYIGY